MTTESCNLDGLTSSHHRLVHLLRRSAPASRAELAVLCGLTPAAVSMLTQDLIARGIVVEAGRRKGGRGAPQIDLVLAADAGFALGIHADHSSVNLTAVDFCGCVRGEYRVDNGFSRFDDVVAAIVAGAGRMLAEAGLPRVAAIGAGFALATRFVDGKVVLNLADDVKSWDGSDIVARLRRALGCPVLVENDANAAAIGELSLGNPKAYDSFFYLYLASGIGGAVVLDGRLHRGWRGNAGEIGALRPRTGSRPSFDDLADHFAAAGVTIPSGRDPDEWEAVLERHPALTDRWLDRAGPEAARLAFAVVSVLEPPAIYVGGTLPPSLRRRLAEWMDCGRAELFDGATLRQPDIVLPERPARSSASAGAAAMILRQFA